MYHILNRLHTLESQTDSGTDYQNELNTLRRNYLTLVSNLLSLEYSYDFILLLDEFNCFQTVLDSLIAFCYVSDYTIQKSALCIITKLTSIYVKNLKLEKKQGVTESTLDHIIPDVHKQSFSMKNEYNDFTVDDGINIFEEVVNSSIPVDGAPKKNLRKFTIFLHEKVVPMLFGIFKLSNLQPTDNKIRSVIAEVANIHFEILKLQGYNYPFYLGKVFFKSANIPSPYPKNLLTVLSSNDRKACVSLLSNYSSHVRTTSSFK